MKAETPWADAAEAWGAVEVDSNPTVDEEEWCCDVAGPGCVRLSGPLCPEWSVCHVCASRQPGAVSAEGAAASGLGSEEVGEEYVDYGDVDPVDLTEGEAEQPCAGMTAEERWQFMVDNMD